jgi:pimeloyl-ACP methyl ester carboxylesterase
MRELTLRGLAASLAHVPAATLERAASGMATWSGTRSASLRALRVPTLVLAAGADLLTSDAESLAREIPGARCVVVRGAGHALAVEAADRVSEALLEFFGSFGSRAGETGR